MRRFWSLLIAALALVALTGAPATAAAKPKPCAQKGSKTVASNRWARAFTAEDPDVDNTTVLFGCLKSKGKPFKLAVFQGGIVRTSLSGKVVLNRRFAALVQAYTYMCAAECPPNRGPGKYVVVTGDLLRRHRTRLESGAVKDGTLLVGDRGTPAWLQDGMGATELHAGSELVDTGAIDRIDLAGTTLSWVNGGVSKTRTLR